MSAQAIGWTVEVTQGNETWRAFCAHVDHRDAIRAAVRAMPWRRDDLTVQIKAFAVHTLVGAS